MMNIIKVREQAFRQIQENAQLWRQWNEAKTEHERTLMLSEQIYSIAFVAGVISCEANQGR